MWEQIGSFTTSSCNEGTNYSCCQLKKPETSLDNKESNWDDELLCVYKIRISISLYNFYSVLILYKQWITRNRFFLMLHQNYRISTIIELMLREKVLLERVNIGWLRHEKNNKCIKYNFYTKIIKGCVKSLNDHLDQTNKNVTPCENVLDKIKQMISNMNVFMLLKS